MDTIAIKGNPRAEFGKKSSRNERAAGSIPCVIYGGKEPIHFTTTLADVKNLVYTSDFLIGHVTVEGKTHKCILKAVQFHPVTDSIVHIDFQELIEDRKIIVEVPIRFRGTSPGVKAGGKLLQSMRKAKIKAEPKDLVSELILDISGMELGSSIRVRNIDINPNVEIMHNGSIPVAVIEIPRALRGQK